MDGLLVGTLPPARLDLVGTCNRCGLCCTTVVDGKRLVCEYLRADWPVKPLGMPEASRCSVYERRRGGQHPLPIRLLDARGTPRQLGQCFKDAWQEDQAIAERGLERGCSLRLPTSEGRLMDFTPHRRR
jgi:hypothetical protein